MVRLRESNDRICRRTLVRIGGLSLGSVPLFGPLLEHAFAAANKPVVSEKSVVFLFLHGGPSQFETFDPKMSAPKEIRCTTGEVATSIPGVTFGGSFPKLARLADRLVVVRSFTTGDGNHDIKPIVGPHTFGANLGSIYARVAGANHPVTGIPTNAILFPRSVDKSTQAGTNAFGKFAATGAFGASLAPFDPGTGGPLLDDLKLAVPIDRLTDRRGLLAQFDGQRVLLDDAVGGDALDRMRRQALQMIAGGIANAFDLSHEHPRTLDRYDTAPLVRPEGISKKWNNYNNYVDNAKSLGKLLLLARRLCEAGCGFVTVTTNFVWDMHADVNNAGVAEGMGYMGVPLDHAIAAFLEDVQARGLSDRILLVVCGEMGRTPRINQNGGRDHWGKLAPLLLSGGGLRLGQVIGQSTRDGGEPNSIPITMQNLVGTIFHTLFDVGELRLVPGMPREIAQTMAGWSPIPGL